MIELWKRLGVRLGLAVICLFLAGGAHAQLDVTPTVSFSSGLYHYDYTITNNTLNDVLIVTLEGLAREAGAVQNLTAPAGFLTSFDSGLGLVDFLADTDVFAVGSSLSGFAFDSPYGPSPSTFTALDATGMGLSGATVTAAVPEPGAAALLAGLTACGILVRTGRRRARK